MRRSRREDYASLNKYKSVPGLISICMGIGVIVGFLLLFFVSYMLGGEAGIWIGVLGILLFLVAVAAVVVAIIGLRDSEAQAKRSVVGLLFNGIIITIVILTYIL